MCTLNEHYLLVLGVHLENSSRMLLRHYFNNKQPSTCGKVLYFSDSKHAKKKTPEHFLPEQEGVNVAASV